MTRRQNRADAPDNNGPFQNSTLQVRRVIPAPPDRVFTAWTNPSEIEKWWGPKNVRCLSAEVDLRVGGQYRIANQTPDGTIVMIVGVYEIIDRPNVLTYTWSTDEGTRSSERISVRFERHRLGTKVVLRHELISTTTLRDQHEQGWVGCLDGLVEYAVSMS